MVCNRCILAVKGVLTKLEIASENITLGEITLERELAANDRQKLNSQLNELGFEIIDDKKSRLIEQIKTIIIDLVHHRKAELKTNLSDYLSVSTQHDYNYLSNLFSEVEGTTIEKFFIAQKIERVKELLVYDELSLSEIAYQLNYSSVAHLSNQFKKVTGLTPSHFKQLRSERRKPLDQV